MRKEIIGPCTLYCGGGQPPTAYGDRLMAPGNSMAVPVIGIEPIPEYVGIAEKRLANTNGAPEHVSPWGGGMVGA